MSFWIEEGAHCPNCIGGIMGTVKCANCGFEVAGPEPEELCDEQE